jgi:hypothetical protein
LPIELPIARAADRCCHPDEIALLVLLQSWFIESAREVAKPPAKEK